MRRLRARLPTPNSLVAFEAAGRLCSFTLAASELSVTQAAVGRQIRSLEARLGTTLFDRTHRSLRLTRDGQQFHQIVSASLERIAQAATDLTARHNTRRLTVSCTQGFATFWLVPRLGRFRERVPEIDLRVVTFDGDTDLAAEGIDLAILYGNGHWPGLQPEFFLDEEVYPVCSPVYLESRPPGKPLRTPKDLIGETLLYPNYRTTWIDWAHWFGAMGVPVRDLGPGVHFYNYTNAIQAALNSQGIALGWGHLCDDALAAGTLVRPIPFSYRTDWGFFIANLANGSDLAALFEGWLKEEAAAQASAHPRVRRLG